MIFEQAIHHLPEILTGSGYPSQSYEGGIVSAFAMAVLQELNARNAPNPLSLIQCEKPFRSREDSWQVPDGNRKRYLRADMHLNLAGLRVGSKSLATYGWRHRNWLEGKFFRAYHKQTGLPKKNINQSVLTGSLLADLYRIIALPPRSADKSGFSTVGRYLLHVYSGAIEHHLSLTRNKREDRKWLRALTEPGQQLEAEFSLKDEAQTVVKCVGRNLADVIVNFECTNLIVDAVGNPHGLRTFKIVLSRIDAFRLELDGIQWGQGLDRKYFSNTQNEEQAHEHVSSFIGSRIELAGDFEEQPPPKSTAEPVEVEDE